MFFLIAGVVACVVLQGAISALGLEAAPGALLMAAPVPLVLVAVTLALRLGAWSRERRPVPVPVRARVSRPRGAPRA
jgi:hypothetical protein